MKITKITMISIIDSFVFHSPLPVTARAEYTFLCQMHNRPLEAFNTRSSKRCVCITQSSFKTDRSPISERSHSRNPVVWM